MHIMLFLRSTNIIIDMIKALVNCRLRWSFGTEALNLRISEKDPLTNQRYDKHLNRYGHLIRSFVLKRRLLRSQIWPKIHIIDESPAAQQVHLCYQGLFAMKKSMRDEMMQAIARNDPSKINSAFIISNFSQDHFKQMLDEYVGKVLVCGKAPSGQAQLAVEQKAKQLYLQFYFGQPTTPLQRQLEQVYLSQKQFKFLKAQSKKKTTNPVMIEECRFTESEQRILEEKQNWVATGVQLSDINYRSYFLPLDYPSRLPFYKKCSQLLVNWGWVDELRFEWSTSKHYSPKHVQYYNWVQQKILVRVMNHIKSLEFTSALNIPHDYMIEAQMVQIHFWLILDRLKKCDSIQAKLLARGIYATLNREIIRSASSLNVKKSNLLVTSLERMLEMNTNILEMHFNRSNITRGNLYRGIDALVWSCAFAEKVHRYADEVYIFADYLIQNFKHMQQHSQEDIFNGVIEFDPYLITPNYRALIQKVNPPLSPAQFQKQFNSNSAKKDYYYARIQQEMEDNLPQDLQSLSSNRKISTKFSFAEFIQPFRNLQIKYFSFKTLDHYSKMEAQKKESEKMDEKGTWKSESDRVKSVEDQFQSIKNIKNKRKNIDSQAKK